MGYLIPDSVLNFLGGFDWVTPLVNEAQDFTELQYSGNHAGAVACKQALEAEGIPCRIEGGGLFTNACVYTRRDRAK